MGSDRRVGIITQARTTSTRLPRKVLLVAGGKTVLEHHIDRLKKAGYPVFVATTTNDTDEDIVKFCESRNILYHRGSEQDVLSRFYECAKKYNLDVIVRVTSDCPLIDGELVAQGVHTFLSMPENSYVSNCIERTYPRGFDYEVFSFSALENAFKKAKDFGEREHVTPYIRNIEKNIGVQLAHVKSNRDASEYRLTLDEQDDWTLIKRMIEEYHANEKNVNEIIDLLTTNKFLSQINAHIEQKKI